MDVWQTAILASSAVGLATLLATWACSACGTAERATRATMAAHATEASEATQEPQQGQGQEQGQETAAADDATPIVFLCHRARTSMEPLRVLVRDAHNVPAVADVLSRSHVPHLPIFMHTQWGASTRNLRTLAYKLRLRARFRGRPQAVLVLSPCSAATALAHPAAAAALARAHVVIDTSGGGSGGSSTGMGGTGTGGTGTGGKNADRDRGVPPALATGALVICHTS